MQKQGRSRSVTANATTRRGGRGGLRGGYMHALHRGGGGSRGDAMFIHECMLARRAVSGHVCMHMLPYPCVLV